MHLKRSLSIIILFSAILFGTVFSSFGQTDTTSSKKDSLDFYDMSLDQLLKLKAHGVPSELEALINSLISVASKKPLTTRESPSIVTLVTREEIKNSGARDLIDVLRLVPGFDFGVDVDGVVDIGIRGNWAHEGKALLLIDGQEMNEVLYGTNQFGNHYPIEHIEKIEIIRGPGSAIYGGFAEYGVINIVTRKGGDINGVSVSGIYGQMKDDYARRNINISVGKKINKFEYSLSGLVGQGNRSDQTFTDLYGKSYKMNGNSNNDPRFFNLGLSFDKLSLRCIGDFYQTRTQDSYDHTLTRSLPESFNSVFAELKYIYKVSDKLTLTPRFNYKNQVPWYGLDHDSISKAFNKQVTRATVNVTASYNLTRYINFVIGSEFYHDLAKDKLDSSYFSDSTKQVNYNNIAFFLQGLVKTRPVNIILGARYDQHNAYGNAFVPRVGLTKKYNKFHFKALFSNAFRAPSIENINFQIGSGIKPEKTQVMELEIGYQVTHASIFTVNFFDITTKDPIVYYYDITTLQDAYRNYGKSGTRGIEAEYRIKSKWGFVTANYSFYTTAGKQRIADYASGDSTSLVAFPDHKFNLYASINITPSLSINPSVSFIGARWGFTSLDTSSTSLLEKIDPVVLTNLFIHYKTPVKGLAVGIGVYDMFDQKFMFIQPYNGYHAPLPGPSREFIFRLQYDLHFKKKSEK